VAAFHFVPTDEINGRPTCVDLSPEGNHSFHKIWGETASGHPVKCVRREIRPFLIHFGPPT
jgi:hypothetical protein